MNRIDKFAYINLAKRKDRDEHIRKELARFGIPSDKIVRIDAIESEKGAYGCALSQMKACEAFRDSGDGVWCILEDDHYFTQSREDTDKIVNEFLDNKELDVFLGCYCNVRGRKLNKTSFYRVTQSSMTSFYIVKRNLVDGLVASHKQSARTLNPKYGKKTGIAGDWMWNNLMKVFVFVIPEKLYGSQIISYSNIRNETMNYDTYVGIKV